MMSARMKLAGLETRSFRVYRLCVGRARPWARPAAKIGITSSSAWRIKSMVKSYLHLSSCWPCPDENGAAQNSPGRVPRYDVPSTARQETVYRPYYRNTVLTKVAQYIRIPKLHPTQPNSSPRAATTEDTIRRTVALSARALQEEADQCEHAVSELNCSTPRSKTRTRGTSSEDRCL